MKDFRSCLDIYCTFAFLCVASLCIPSIAELPEDGENSVTEQPVVETKSGPVQGFVTKTEDNKDINVFLGIPYAAPPVGELRFQRPRKVEPWTITLQAIKPQPFCYQEIPKTFSAVKELRLLTLRPWSEDCLHLNIWSPSLNQNKAPIMFFIHGGAFVFGSGLFMTDGTLLASEGLVVVTINYRLGAFGFFNLGSNDAPGNMGLMDQNLALQWIKENAEAFGGDPDKITLMGMSAGSASVGYHLLSPKSSGLFRSAIMMSGVPTNYWAIIEPERSIEKSKALVNSVGCNSPDTNAMSQCLRQRHPEDILEQSRNPEAAILMDKFVPTIDGNFIIEHPSVSVASGRFNPGDVMIGTTSDEAAQFMISGNPEVFTKKDGRLFRRDFLKVVQKSFPGLTSLKATALDIAYTNWDNPDDPYALRDAARVLYSDSIMSCHINEFSEKLALTGKNVYRYVYDHKLHSPYVPEWSGAVHSQDQLPVLGPEQVLKQFGLAQESSVGSRFRRHFVNFAFSGNPNLDKKKFPEEPAWPKYDSRKLHLKFNVNSTIREESQTGNCAVWLHLLPLLDQKNTC